MNKGAIPYTMLYVVIYPNISTLVVCFKMGPCFLLTQANGAHLAPSREDHCTSWLIGFPTLGYHTPL